MIERESSLTLSDQLSICASTQTDGGSGKCSFPEVTLKQISTMETSLKQTGTSLAFRIFLADGQRRLGSEQSIRPKKLARREKVHNTL
jgi:hypothetical protein